MAYNQYIVYNRIAEREEMEDFLEFAKRMRFQRGYSLFNSGLIYLQRPGAYIAYTENQWNKMDRYVKPEAAPIVVTVPFGPVEFLYELGDTEGKPYRGVDADALADQIPEHLGEKHLNKAIKVLSNLGIRYSTTNKFGIQQNGSAELLEEPMKITVDRNKKQVSVYTRYNILVNNSISDSEKVRTILHEVGHILCGHVHYSTKDKNIIYSPDRNEDELSHYVKECEAEEVCRIFCRLLNYEYDPSEYLKGHRSKDDTYDNVSQFHILTAVHNLIHAWEDVDKQNDQGGSIRKV